MAARRNVSCSKVGHKCPAEYQTFARSPFMPPGLSFGLSGLSHSGQFKRKQRIAAPGNEERGVQGDERRD